MDRGQDWLDLGCRSRSGRSWSPPIGETLTATSPTLSAPVFEQQGALSEGSIASGIEAFQVFFKYCQRLLE